MWHSENINLLNSNLLCEYDRLPRATLQLHNDDILCGWPTGVFCHTNLLKWHCARSATGYIGKHAPCGWLHESNVDTAQCLFLSMKWISFKHQRLALAACYVTTCFIGELINERIHGWKDSIDGGHRTERHRHVRLLSQKRHKKWLKKIWSVKTGEWKLTW